MTKKNLLIAICAVVVVAALVVAAIFVFGGKDNVPTVQKPALSGTWVVAANYVNDVPVFVDSQFMVFTQEHVTVYQGDTVYAESNYTINDALQLQAPDISRTYKVAVKSDNCVRLYENTTSYMLLIRSSDRSAHPVTVDALSGKWNISLKGDVANGGESMEFNATSLNYYKAGSATPITVDFAVADGLVSIDALGLKMRGYVVSDNCVILVEEGGTLWELTK